MRYLITIVLLAQPLAALPLITNGSFEEPRLTTTQNLTGPFTLGAWTGYAPSQGGNAGLVVGTNNGLSPADGTQHFTFNGGNPSDRGYIEQTLPTLAGQLYDLTFALGRAGGGQPLSLALTLNGQNSTSYPAPANGYTTYTLSYTATGPTTLRFTDTSESNSISDLYLDAVSLTQATPVPDHPNPAAEMIIALGALLLIRRR